MTTWHAALLNHIATSFPMIEPGTADDYVRSAVRIVSRDVAMPKRATITFVPGTAAYTLPDDYLQIIRWSNPTNREPPSFGISGTTLYVYDDLSLWTDLTWTLHYGAAHILNGAGGYPDMTAELADIVIIKAKSLVLQDMVDAATARDGVIGYDQGEVAVKFEDSAKTMAGIQSQIDSYELLYERQLKRYLGMR